VESNDKYGVVIQARMTSTRLPGKVLMDIEGKPMLQRQVERLRAGVGDVPVIVATSESPTDDRIEALCKQLGTPCFRGPLNDVMQRFILCGKKHGVTHIVRVGGDDPLIDPACCKELIRLHREKPYDFMYASNREGWPFGCAAELIAVAALERIHAGTEKPLYLEHTIPYFFDHPGEFSMLKVRAPAALNRPDWAFTVDYPEDMEVVRRIFAELRAEGDYFPLARVIRLMEEKPQIRAINSHLHEGFDK
jgi:spore coat polysaccharide biosynthesis protein SpsF